MTHEAEVEAYMQKIMSLRERAHDEARSSVMRARDMIRATRLAAVVIESQIIEREQAERK